MRRLQIEYSPGRHVPALDYLRGLAILLILIFHFFDFIPIFRIGWIGVDIFFVLSGFLITGILLDTKGKAYFYRNFILRRILRIFPLYYFVLIVSLLVIPFILPGIFGSGYAYYTQNQTWFWLYCQNWLFSYTGFPKNQALIPLWSLAVEEQFYLFWPLIVGLFSVRRLFFISIGIIFLSVFFRLFWGTHMGLVFPYNYVATLSRMDALSIGAIIAILARKRIEWLEKYTWLIFVVSGLAFLLVLVKLRVLMFSRLAEAYTFIDLLAGCLLVFMLRKKPYLILRPLHHPVFSFLGKYSYGIYIYHIIVYTIMKNTLSSKLDAVLGNGKTSLTLLGIIAIGVTVFISIVSYKYLEQPFLKLKKFFSTK